RSASRSFRRTRACRSRTSEPSSRRGRLTQPMAKGYLKVFRSLGLKPVDPEGLTAEAPPHEADRVAWAFPRDVLDLHHRITHHRLLFTCGRHRTSSRGSGR